MAVALFELIPPVLLTRPHPAEILTPQNDVRAALAPMPRVWPIQNPYWPRDFRALGGRPDRYLSR